MLNPTKSSLVQGLIHLSTCLLCLERKSLLSSETLKRDLKEALHEINLTLNRTQEQESESPATMLASSWFSSINRLVSQLTDVQQKPDTTKVQEPGKTNQLWLRRIHQSYCIHFSSMPEFVQLSTSMKEVIVYVGLGNSIKFYFMQFY